MVQGTDEWENQMHETPRLRGRGSTECSARIPDTLRGQAVAPPKERSQLYRGKKQIKKHCHNTTCWIG